MSERKEGFRNENVLNQVDVWVRLIWLDIIDFHKHAVLTNQAWSIKGLFRLTLSCENNTKSDFFFARVANHSAIFILFILPDHGDNRLIQVVVVIVVVTLILEFFC